MNSGRGWNPNLEGSFLPEYSAPEAEFWTHCTSRFYIWPLQFSTPDTSPIAGYSVCTKKLEVLVFRVFPDRGQTRV